MAEHKVERVYEVSRLSQGERWFMAFLFGVGIVVWYVSHAYKHAKTAAANNPNAVSSGVFSTPTASAASPSSGLTILGPTGLPNTALFEQYGPNRACVTTAQINPATAMQAWQ